MDRFQSLVSLFLCVLLLSSSARADPQYLLYDFSNSLALSVASFSPSSSTAVYSNHSVGYEVDFSLAFANPASAAGVLTSSVDSNTGRWTTTATSSTQSAVAIMTLDGMNPSFSYGVCRVSAYTADVLMIVDLYALDIQTIEIDYAAQGSGTLVLTLSSFSIAEGSDDCNSCSVQTLITGSSLQSTQTWIIDVVSLPSECVAIAWSFSLEVDVYSGSSISIARVELIPTYSGDDYVECLDIFSLYDQSISPVTISTLPGYYSSTLQQEYADDGTFFGTVFENMGIVSSIEDIGEGYGTCSIWYDEETMHVSTTGASHFLSSTALTFFSFFVFNTDLYSFCPGEQIDGTREGFYFDIYSDDYIVPMLIEVEILDYNYGANYLCEAIVDMTGEIFVPFDAFRAMDRTMSTIIVNDLFTCEILLRETENFSMYITSTMETNFEIRGFKIVQY